MLLARRQAAARTRIKAFGPRREYHSVMLDKARDRSARCLQAGVRRALGRLERIKLIRTQKRERAAAAAGHVLSAAARRIPYPPLLPRARPAARVLQAAARRVVQGGVAQARGKAWGEEDAEAEAGRGRAAEVLQGGVRALLYRGKGENLEAASQKLAKPLYHGKWENLEAASQKVDPGTLRGLEERRAKRERVAAQRLARLMRAAIERKKGLKRMAFWRPLDAASALQARVRARGPRQEHLLLLSDRRSAAGVCADFAKAALARGKWGETQRAGGRLQGAIRRVLAQMVRKEKDRQELERVEAARQRRAVRRIQKMDRQELERVEAARQRLAVRRIQAAVRAVAPRSAMAQERAAAVLQGTVRRTLAQMARKEKDRQELERIEGARQRRAVRRIQAAVRAGPPRRAMAARLALLYKEQGDAARVLQRVERKR
ncbi:hypothetical protein T484DRAFT_1889409, partial [Baffinella frigidus]